MVVTTAVTTAVIMVMVVVDLGILGLMEEVVMVMVAGAMETIMQMVQVLPALGASLGL